MNSVNTEHLNGRLELRQFAGPNETARFEIENPTAIVLCKVQVPRFVPHFDTYLVSWHADAATAHAERTRWVASCKYRVNYYKSAVRDCGTRTFAAHAKKDEEIALSKLL